MLYAMRWVLRVVVGGVVVAAVVLVTLNFARSNDLLPDSVSDQGPAPGAARGSVYLVEIASRPDYRLVARDLDTGEDVPLFIVPETGVIYSVAPSPEGESLVMAYSADYNVPGTGLYRLPLADAADTVRLGAQSDEVLIPLVEERPDFLFEDVAFGSDPGTIWATLDQGTTSSVVGIDLESGRFLHEFDDAIEPAVGPGWVAYLNLEPDESRRSISLFDLASEATSVIEVLDDRYDLGNLLIDEQHNRLLFTALVPEDEKIIQIGEPAGAHGSHDGPAQWLAIDLTTTEVNRLVDHEPLSFRDAAALDSGEVAAITSSGLIIVSDPVELVVESRVLGAVAS